LQKDLCVRVVEEVFKPNKRKVLALNRILDEYFRLVKSPSMRGVGVPSGDRALDLSKVQGRGIRPTAFETSRSPCFSRSFWRKDRDPSSPPSLRSMSKVGKKS
jgi:hypothetical protein